MTNTVTDADFEHNVGNAMVTCPKTHHPDTQLQEILALFENDHVHMVLVVESNGRLITTIERSDVGAAESVSTPISSLGTLAGRTAGPLEGLVAVEKVMVAEGRRRLAVVDSSGRLLGLLCLKRDGSGYCSDAGIRERAMERERP